MLTCVNIDEKWFYLTWVNVSYIVVPREEAPHRTIGHKSHVPKAMCLTTMASPRQNPEDGTWWDGKLGNCFFVEYVPAKLNSKNRKKGMLVTTPVSVCRENSVDM
jgi:hypothetical protein